jgi:hypothetical protein
VEICEINRRGGSAARQQRKLQQELCRRIEESKVIQEAARQASREIARIFHYLCRAWRPTLAGDNPPPWWDIPAVQLVDSPFEGTPWELPATPRSPLERLIFHREDCSCPNIAKDRLLLASSMPQLFISGRSDYQGVESRRCIADDCRQYANAIYIEVNKEFTRLFAAARIQTTHCSASQDLWRVFHYCNLQCNVGRTRQGRTVGRLLHHESYDALNHDCVRFIQPHSADRASRCALRIIPRIIEHCLFRSKHLGPGGPARPVPGSWGYSIASKDTILKYVYQRDQFPQRGLLNFKIYKFGKGGCNPNAAYCVAGPLPEACICPVQTLRPNTLEEELEPSRDTWFVTPPVVR